MLCYAAVLGSSMIHISNSTHRTRNYLKKPVIVIINDTVFFFASDIHFPKYEITLIISYNNSK